MSLMPWNQLSASVSPFVVVFSKIGIPGAGYIINLVVITAAASSCNTGIYSTARSLYAQARRGQAPRVFAKLNARHIPANAVHLSSACMLIGVVLNALVPDRVFVWVTSLNVVGTLSTWIVIMVAHLGYRRKVRAGLAPKVSFRMPGAPIANGLVIAFIVIVYGMLWLTPDTRIALYVTPFWFALLSVGYWRLRRHPPVALA
jgi:AAT family amino acid transporter/D-serine/D-alanine/glycine transporter